MRQISERSYVYARYRTFEVHIGRIRAKVEEDPSRPSQILPVRGLGYRHRTESRP
ncbi:MAG: winged helix-turn-helix domain-containing protein [Acidimicrobiales bacterium]